MSNVISLPFTHPMSGVEYTVMVDLDTSTYARYSSDTILTLDFLDTKPESVKDIITKVKSLNWILGYHIVSGNKLDVYINPAFVRSKPAYFSKDGLTVEIDTFTFDGSSLDKINAIFTN